MSRDEPDRPDTHDSAPRSRGRLRRSGRQLVRLGTVLTVLSLVVALVGGWATRSLLDHLQSNSAELLDGTATVRLAEGAQRTLYVTGGLVAPGEIVPTPVEDISCTVTGPQGEVPFTSLAEQGKKVGIDTVLARLQVVGSFQAQDTGEHRVDCDGLGVVVAPEVGPANALARLGGLALGSLGAFLGLTMLLIGGALLLVLRGSEDEDDADADAAPPQEGAEEWWDGKGPPDPTDARFDAEPDGAGTGPDADGDEDDYLEVSDEELAAMSDEEIQTLVASGALIFVDDDEPGEPTDAEQTYR